ncbi:retrovirus-related Pol polyprotein from transposon 412 [Trichonephila clavipes]|nr:retrovirus-related Pol polyprotein from transposon 412 [Trichonephila clavipes]
MADPEIKPIIEFKELSDEKPNWQDIASFYPTTKSYWALWDSLYLRKVLKELHGSPIGGHFGVRKTLQKVRECFYWNNVRSDVEKGCRICDHCAACKGSLPRSSEGNNNILVVKDYFTKWPEAYPILDQDASTVAEVLVQHWISRFRVLLQLHSDQGRNFDSAVCNRLCEILAIDKTRKTALYPQSDSMVEKSAIHETTDHSPSQMLFGRDLRLPADLLFSRPPDAPLAPEENIEKSQARMEEMHHLARERIGMASEKMKTRYDARETGHDFHEGDKVWLWNPKRRKGLSPKLQTNWEGPYTVLKRLNDVVVRIQKSPHSKPKVIHYNRLAPYLGQD